MCEEVTRSDCVCSKHFLLSDYRPTGKRRYLLRHAVPSQFPKYRKSSKSKVDEKKTKNHKSPKSKHGPVPEEIYHSLLGKPNGIISLYETNQIKQSKKLSH